MLFLGEERQKAGFGEREKGKELDFSEEDGRPDVTGLRRCLVRK
jgi:hypothetical protein